MGARGGGFWCCGESRRDLLGWARIHSEVVPVQVVTAG